jgi:hypothetical protein
MILLPLPPKCWDYRPIAPRLPCKKHLKRKFQSSRGIRNLRCHLASPENPSFKCLTWKQELGMEAELLRNQAWEWTPCRSTTCHSCFSKASPSKPLSNHFSWVEILFTMSYSSHLWWLPLYLERRSMIWSQSASAVESPHYIINYWMCFNNWYGENK